MRKLYNYQSIIIEQIKQMPSVALFLEQGTGKTQITLSEFYTDKDIDTLILFGSPNGLQSVWESEVFANNMDVFFLKWIGKRNKEFEYGLEQFISTRKKRIFICNIEVLQTKSTLHNLLYDKIFPACNNITLAIDQSASIKNPNANKTKALLKLSNFFNTKIVKRRILEGDACSGGLYELYSQFNFLNKDIIGLKSFTAFKHKYCEIGYFKEITGYKCVNDLMGRIKPFTIWLKADECMELPEVIHQSHIFYLSKKEKEYENLIKMGNEVFNRENEDEIADMEMDNKLTNELSKILYLQNVCSGRVETDINKEIKSTKLERLKVLIQDIILNKGSKKEQLVIFVNYIFEIKLIEKLLKELQLTYCLYYGGNTDIRAKNMLDFVNGEYDIIIGTQSAMGKGFTLTNARHVIFYSRHWSYRLYYESIKRLHRNTQEHKVFVHDLISVGTIERDIVRCLQSKQDVLKLVYELSNNEDKQNKTVERKEIQPRMLPEVHSV